MSTFGAGWGDPHRVDRSRDVSLALAEAARRARQRRRGSQLTLSRRRSWWRHRLRLIGFIAIVAAPSLAACLYFGLAAADQYAAEMRFTVRNGEVPKLDELGSLTGLMPVTVIQDTQVVAAFVQSRALVEKLDATLGLRALFRAPGADLVARLRAEAPVEKLVEYWRGMSDVSISLPSGIVTVTVRAFRAEDALAVARQVLAESEALVNGMNARMHEDALASAQADMERAGRRLGEARAAMQAGRNARGVLDAGRAGQGLADLLQGLQADRLRLREELETQSRAVSADAPQMRALRLRLEALDAQVREVRGAMTKSPDGEAAAQEPLSSVMTDFDQRTFELTLAERHYAAAVASLELARTLGEGKHVYLNAFVRPALPQDARYPRRLFWIGAVVAGSLALWGLVLGLAGFIRAKMA